MKPHLSDDQLLDRLYGLGQEEAEAHLRECEECSRRVEAFEARRAEAATGSRFSGEASPERLAAQRRNVYARLEQRPALHGPWAPAALAAGLVLAMGVFLYHPSRSTRPHPVPRQAVIHPVPAARPELTDEQFFSVVYSMEESVEPEAAAPIHALFEGEAPDQQ